MADTPSTRESILARIVDVAAAFVLTLDPKGEAVRNDLEIPEKRDFIVILDGDEERREGAPQSTRRGPGRCIVDMVPEIYVILQRKREHVGSALNSAKAGLLAALVNDQMLIDLTKDGEIEYLGFTTAFAAGRTMDSEGLLSIKFPYLFKP